MAAHVKELLAHFFAEHTWKVKLLAEWNIIAGTLADKMRLEKIENETVFIGVYHSAWLQELSLLAPVLKKAINQHLGQSHVQLLRFKFVAPNAKHTALPSVTAHIQTQKCELISLSLKEKDALKAIKDTELQHALHQFLSRCHYQKVRP